MWVLTVGGSEAVNVIALLEIIAEMVQPKIYVDLYAINAMLCSTLTHMASPTLHHSKENNYTR